MKYSILYILYCVFNLQIYMYKCKHICLQACCIQLVVIF